MAPQVKFYTDEHVSRAVVRGLRSRGIDVVTVVELNLLGASDERHISLAHEQGRVVFTQDADFLRLHTAGHEHSGIVYAPQGTPMGDVIRGLVLIHQILDAEEMVGHIEFL